MNLACSSSRSNMLYCTASEGAMHREEVTPWSHPDCHSAPSQRRERKGFPFPETNENCCWVTIKPRNWIIVFESISFNSILLYGSRETLKKQKGSQIHKSSINSKGNILIISLKTGTPLSLSKSAWVAQAPLNTSPWNSLLQSLKSEESGNQKEQQNHKQFSCLFH